MTPEELQAALGAPMLAPDQNLQPFALKPEHVRTAISTLAPDVWNAGEWLGGVMHGNVPFGGGEAAQHIGSLAMAGASPMAVKPLKQLSSAAQAAFNAAKTGGDLSVFHPNVIKEALDFVKSKQAVGATNYIPQGKGFMALSKAAGEESKPAVSPETLQHLNTLKEKYAKEAPSAKPQLSEEAINKKLASNPGASIFDIATGSPISYADIAKQHAQKWADIAKNFGQEPTYPPDELIHNVLGHDIAPRTYASPEHEAFSKEFELKGYHGSSATDPYTEFKLPEELDTYSPKEGAELGTHFGTRKAGHDIMGGEIGISDKLKAMLDPWSWRSKEGAAGPRIYPVVARAKNEKLLEMDDLYSWGPGNVRHELRRLGFPTEEIDNLKSIQDIRKYLNDKGFEGVRYKNAAEDPGSTSYLLWELERFRSPFAEFDPAKRNSRNLGAGLAGTLGLGNLVRGLGEQAETQ